MDDKLVTELKIIENEENIFTKGDKYVIPLYQRAYAWTDEQIKQLIEDVIDIDHDKNYYIGTLIVHKKDNQYEVVDGQQRLTTLYLLLSYLGYKLPYESLSFACRDISNYTLKNIKAVIDEDKNFDSNKFENGIKTGIGDIKRFFRSEELKNKFKDNLKKVLLYRIEVPPYTDLNSYFEIMNTRGEQLELQDIVKAEIMKGLEDEPRAMDAFAIIWDACGDMEGYVQMHFSPESRKLLFGEEWNNMPSDSFDDLIEIAGDTKEKDAHKDDKARDKDSLEHIISDEFKNEDKEKTYNDEGKQKYFSSIIGFKFFLIHVLKVFVRLNNNGIDEYTDSMIDDKKLDHIFKGVIDEGVEKDHKLAKDRKDFAKKFIVCLLRTRYLFDNFIIKREHTNVEDNGKWSLKMLKKSNSGKSKSSAYTVNLGDDNESAKVCHERILMLEAALRVSYTSPKVMQWINELLFFLSANDCQNAKFRAIENIEDKVEDIIRRAVNKSFFSVKGYDSLGVDTPHIVFNYLDYLLWRDGQDKDFEFEFRNSVEHWYPQNPENKDHWDNVDMFGNLCIIQRHINSKFSNLTPEAKKDDNKDKVAKASLKLRLMAKATVDDAGMTSSENWRKKACAKHQEDMLKILQKACNPLSNAQQLAN